jgi:hypothetical protein
MARLCAAHHRDLSGEEGRRAVCEGVAARCAADAGAATACATAVASTADERCAAAGANGGINRRRNSRARSGGAISGYNCCFGCGGWRRARPRGGQGRGERLGERWDGEETEEPQAQQGKGRCCRCGGLHGPRAHGRDGAQRFRCCQVSCFLALLCFAPLPAVSVVVTCRLRGRATGTGSATAGTYLQPRPDGERHLARHCTPTGRCAETSQREQNGGDGTATAWCSRAPRKSTPRRWCAPASALMRPTVPVLISRRACMRQAKGLLGLPSRCFHLVRQLTPGDSALFVLDFRSNVLVSLGGRAGKPGI